MRLGETLANRVSVVSNSNAYEFYAWDDTGILREKVVTIYALSGQNRESQAAEEGYITLHRTDTVVYVAKLEPASAQYGIDGNTVRDCFRLIQQDWKTGET